MLEQCPECRKGGLRVYVTRTIGATRVQYLRCDACGHTGKRQSQVDPRGNRANVEVKKSDLCTRS